MKIGPVIVILIFCIQPLILIGLVVLILEIIGLKVLIDFSCKPIDLYRWNEGYCKKCGKGLAFNYEDPMEGWYVYRCKDPTCNTFVHLHTLNSIKKWVDFERMCA